MPKGFGVWFGLLVRQQRGIEGLTQQALAVLAFGDEAKKSLISQLENGKIQNPHQRTIDGLVTALNLRIQDLYDAYSEGDDVKRRQFISTGLSAAVMGGAGMTPVSVAAGLSGGYGEALEGALYHGRPVSRQALDDVNTLLNQYRNLDALYGSGRLYSSLRLLLRQVLGLLDCRVSGVEPGEVYRTVSRFQYLVGWTAFEAEHDDLANQHFYAAHTLSRDAGDRDHAAYVLAQQAMVAITNNQPGHCLSLVTAAKAEATDGSAVHVPIMLQEIRALAVIGELRAARRVLDQADRFFGRIHSDDVPDYLHWIEQPSLCSGHTRGFFQSDPAFAVTILEGVAQKPMGPNRRNHVLGLRNLAEARLAAGDHDGALEAIETVIDELKQIPHEGIGRKLSAIMDRCPDRAAVDGLRSRLASVVPVGSA